MSATYQVTSLTTLETSTVSLDKLSRNLQLNSIICCDDRPIGLVTHWDLVFFARTWAGWALEECGEKPPEEVLVALSLVDQWLQDPGSVSSEELRAAARAAAARAAAEAVVAAVWAAGAARAAAARAAAEAVVDAAWAVAGAARAAAYQRQGRFIIEHLKNSSHSSFPFRRT